jgi:hypothetical protein|tara:strand:+ start:82 stop:558 length:477 start_codon:yes stop_codon:yes gene_type:complete
MKITKEKIRSMNPCKDGYQYWLDQGIEDLETFMLRAHKEGHSDWAIWLFTRSVDRPTRLRFSIFCAELVLHIFEKKRPEDNRARKAIETAKAVLADDTRENRQKADAAVDAAVAAAAAVDAAAAADSASAADYADARKRVYFKIITYAIKKLEERHGE